jgi:hypothetical protein
MSDQSNIREDVVAAIVAWRRSNQHKDPSAAWHLINDATAAELLEALRRLKA